MLTRQANDAGDADGGLALPPPPPLRQLLADHPAGLTILCDFDGTLVSIADHPDAVVVAPGVPGLLARLSSALEGRLAVVSGRSLATLDDFLGDHALPMAGSHGGEFRPAPAGPVEALAEPLPESVGQRLHAFAETRPGLMVEVKPFSAAVHYRAAPEARDALLEAAGALAGEAGLAVKHGKMVVELAMPGSDKGSAARRFMETAPFAGTTPVFIGDDVTDEDGFAAVLNLGGMAIHIGEPRPTRAGWRLPSVPALHQWLEEGAPA